MGRVERRLECLEELMHLNFQVCEFNKLNMP